MPVHTKKARGNKAQHHRQVAAKKQRQVARPGRRDNAGAQTCTDSAAIQPPGLHFLAKELKASTLFQCNLQVGTVPDEPGLFEMLDTEAKQLQCIQDLYAIVKAQPKYKNMKEPVWKEATTPFEVILWLLRKLGPLANGDAWTVDTYKEGRKTRYMFVFYKYYTTYYLKQRDEYLSLDFLPFLKTRDEQLHDLIIDIVALVSKKNKVPLWDEDGDYSEQLNWITRHKDNNTVFNTQKSIYVNGIAAEYLALIKRRRRVVTAADLYEKLRAYDANSERKRMVVGWINYGIKLASKPDSVANHTYVPNYVPGPAVTPFRQYKIVWSRHHNDLLHLRAEQKLMEDGRNYGYYYPLMFSITKPGAQINPRPVENFGWGVKFEDSSFPIKFYQFLSEGIKNFCFRYSDYFYKNMLREDATPSERLLLGNDTGLLINSLDRTAINEIA